VKSVKTDDLQVENYSVFTLSVMSVLRIETGVRTVYGQSVRGVMFAQRAIQA